MKAQGGALVSWGQRSRIAVPGCGLAPGQREEWGALGRRGRRAQGRAQQQASKGRGGVAGTSPKIDSATDDDDDLAREVAGRVTQRQKRCMSGCGPVSRYPQLLTVGACFQKRESPVYVEAADSMPGK
jgi:hypothetical protein